MKRILFVTLLLLALSGTLLFIRYKDTIVSRNTTERRSSDVADKTRKHQNEIRYEGIDNTLWPMYQGSQSRNGRSQYRGPKKGTIKWKLPVNGLFEASPVLGYDGTIYVGGHNLKFHAVSPYGKLLWTFSTRDINRNSSAIALDGTIYFPSADYSLYALSKNGELKWVFRTDGRVNSSPAIGDDGTIYFGSHDKHLYALNKNGSLKWKVLLGLISASSPSISSDGTIYIGSYDRHLYAVNKDGSIKWKFKADSGLRATPVIGRNGTIYIGSRKGTFYSISPDGSLMWRFKTDNDIRASAAIAADDTIYFGSWDNYFYALTHNGNLKWKYKTGGPIEASAIIDAEGTIYVGSMGDKIYAFSANGEVLWTVNGGIIHTAPAIGSDGTLYICREHTIIAIGEPLPEISLEPHYNITSGNNSLIVNISNKSSKDCVFDVRIYMITPNSNINSIYTEKVKIKAGSFLKKIFELPVNEKLSSSENYSVFAKLLDPVNGNLIKEISTFVKIREHE